MGPGVACRGVAWPRGHNCGGNAGNRRHEGRGGFRGNEQTLSGMYICVLANSPPPLNAIELAIVTEMLIISEIACIIY